MPLSSNLHFRLCPLAVLVILVLVGCSPQAGRWEIGFEGEAVEHGRNKVRLGDEMVSIPVAKGETAEVIRDRFLVVLRDSGYSIDCLWQEPSQAVVVANGTPVPRGKEYFALVDLPGEPDIMQSPRGISMLLGGPREPGQLEARSARRKANQWIDDLSKTFNPPSTQPLVSITHDESLLDLLGKLRREGMNLEMGTAREVSVDCNQAVVQFEHGSIEGVTLERGYYEHWRVTDVHVVGVK